MPVLVGAIVVIIVYLISKGLGSYFSSLLYLNIEPIIGEPLIGIVVIFAIITGLELLGCIGESLLGINKNKRDL